MAKARLKAAEESVSFADRELILSNGPMKVGRSVGDLKPTAQNAFFHCKVLSRNHAMLWYDVTQRKFYVKDTKSSNGTFVNKTKIGPRDDGCDCPPVEIHSGDTIQFGVEVQEATKKDKDGNPVTVTHGCIVTHVKLFNVDGTEYLRPPNELDQQHIQSVIATQDLYVLNKYINEAKEREVEVEKKLNSFLDVITQLEKQSENGCDNVIREDYLLSKIELLEAQINAFDEAAVAAAKAAVAGGDAASASDRTPRNSNYILQQQQQQHSSVQQLNGSSSTTTLKDSSDLFQNDDNDDAETMDGESYSTSTTKMLEMYDKSTHTGTAEPSTSSSAANGTLSMQRIKLDELNNVKALYEQGAKEFLNRAMLDKIAALDHVAQVENELGRCQSECEYLKNNCLSVEAALKDLVQRHQDQLERSTQLLGELKDAEQGKQQLLNDAERHKRDLELRIDDANCKVQTLTEQVNAAVSESTALRDDLEALEAMRVELLEELKQYQKREVCDQASQTDLTITSDNSSHLIVVNCEHDAPNDVDAASGGVVKSLFDRISSRLSSSSAGGGSGGGGGGSSAGSDAESTTHDSSAKYLSRRRSSGQHQQRQSQNGGTPRSNAAAAERSVSFVSSPGNGDNSDLHADNDNDIDADDSADVVDLREQQSVERFLADISDSGSNNINPALNADEDADDFSGTAGPSLVITAGGKTSSKPVSHRLPLPPSQFDGVYERQETLTEKRPAGAVAHAELDERLAKIEKVIAGYSNTDAGGGGGGAKAGASTHYSSSQSNSLQRSSASSSSNELMQIAEVCTAGFALVGVLFSWFYFGE